MRSRTGPGALGNRPAVLLLALAIAASAALLIAFDSHLSFVADDWELLIGRRGWSLDALSDPFNGNIVLGPALVYKLLLSSFGMGSALPFYLVSISLFLLSAVLLFVYLRPRVGDWLALIGAVLILFLGAAFEDLLWAFQMGFFGAMSAGLGMLVALDREDEQGDRFACALLLISLAFSSLGIAFAAAGLTDVAFGRRPRARRLYLALLPLAAYALWWVAWGHTAESQISLHNLEHLPQFVFDAAAAGITSLLGLMTASRSGPDQSPLLCQALLLVALALGAARVARQRRISRGLALALALALAFWVVAGLDRTSGRYPTSSRYQYPSAIFLLLIAAEVLRGVRIRRLVIAAIAATAIVAALSGVSYLHNQYKESWRPQADSLRSYLAAVDTAGVAADPAFRVVLAPSVVVPTRTYLEAAGEWGSPAFDESELAARPEGERESADLTLAAALGLTLALPNQAERALRCQGLRASTSGHTGIRLSSGRFTLASISRSSIAVLLARFADPFSIHLGLLKPGSELSLRIPTDESSRTWNLGLRGAGAVRLCTTHAESSTARQVKRRGGS